MRTLLRHSTLRAATSAATLLACLSALACNEPASSGSTGGGDTTTKPAEGGDAPKPEGDTGAKPASDGGGAAAEGGEPKPGDDDGAMAGGEGGALPPEVNVVAPPEHEKTGNEPLDLVDVEVELEPQRWGDDQGRHILKIAPKVKVIKDLPDRARVHAKATCQVGDRVLTDIVSVGFFNDLQGIGVGNEKRIDTRVFASSPVATAPSKCSFKFDYATDDDTVHLEDFCWDGSKVSGGLCDGLKPSPSGEGDLVFSNYEVQASERQAFGISPGGFAMTLRYFVRTNKELKQWPTGSTAMACKVGDKVYADVGFQWMVTNPFTLAPGEELVARNWLHGGTPLPGAPEQCDIAQYLDAGWNERKTEHSRVCWTKDGGVRDGRCDPSVAPMAAAAAPTAKTLEISNVSFVTDADFSDKSKRYVRFRFEGTVREPVEPNLSLHATAKCDKAEDSPFIFGADLSLVELGQTVLYSVDAFRKELLDKDPGKCELTIQGRRSSDREPSIEFGKFCITGADPTKQKVSAKGC